MYIDSRTFVIQGHVRVDHTTCSQRHERKTPAVVFLDKTLYAHASIWGVLYPANAVLGYRRWYAWYGSHDVMRNTLHRGRACMSAHAISG